MIDVPVRPLQTSFGAEVEGSVNRVEERELEVERHQMESGFTMNEKRN